jgi:hypothetical protein
MRIHRFAAALCLALAVSAPVLAQAPAPPAEAGIADQDAIALADKVLERMESGDFEGAGADFNAQMQAALGPDKLADVQRQIEATGAVVERAPPRVVRHDGYTVVVYRIHREQASLDATVAFDGDGRVAGLHFVPASGGPQ